MIVEGGPMKATKKPKSVLTDKDKDADGKAKDVQTLVRAWTGNPDAEPSRCA